MREEFTNYDLSCPEISLPQSKTEFFTELHNVIKEALVNSVQILGETPWLRYYF